MLFIRVSFVLVETLVMAEVEVGLRTVVEHITFAVLIRRHRAGIDVEIRGRISAA